MTKVALLPPALDDFVTRCAAASQELAAHAAAADSLRWRASVDSLNWDAQSAAASAAGDLYRLSSDVANLGKDVIWRAAMGRDADKPPDLGSLLKALEGVFAGAIPIGLVGALTTLFSANPDHPHVADGPVNSQLSNQQFLAAAETHHQGPNASSFDPEYGCLPYAQAYVTDNFGPSGPDIHANGNEGAYNLLYQGNNAGSSLKPIVSSRSGAAIGSDLVSLNGASDLTTRLQPGDLMVWRPSAPISADLGSANPDYGHVAVVESVEPARVVISQAGFGQTTWVVLQRTSLGDGVFALRTH